MISNDTKPLLPLLQVGDITLLLIKSRFGSGIISKTSKAWYPFASVTQLSN